MVNRFNLSLLCEMFTFIEWHMSSIEYWPDKMAFSWFEENLYLSDYIDFKIFKSSFFSAFGQYHNFSTLNSNIQLIVKQQTPWKLIE